MVMLNRTVGAETYEASEVSVTAVVGATIADARTSRSGRMA